MIDTLIVKLNGKYCIERYDGQNLDEYAYTAELNHDSLCTYKANNVYFMASITYSEIFDYLVREFGYRF